MLIVSKTKGHQEYIGKTIAQIAVDLCLSPEEAVRRVLLDCEGYGQCIYFSINEEDIRHIMSKEWVCIGSDGADLVMKNAPALHPRYFATFPQFFQTVREYNILPLEKAVFKATGLTASILGLNDRGTLEVGKQADICVFDPQKYASKSTFLKPQAAPEGMYHVLINGRFAVRDQVLTGERLGSALCRK